MLSLLLVPCAHNTLVMVDSWDSLSNLMHYIQDSGTKIYFSFQADKTLSAHPCPTKQAFPANFPPVLVAFLLRETRSPQMANLRPQPVHQVESLLTL